MVATVSEPLRPDEDVDEVHEHGHGQDQLEDVRQSHCSHPSDAVEPHNEGEHDGEHRHHGPYHQDVGHDPPPSLTRMGGTYPGNMRDSYGKGPQTYGFR